MEVIGRKAALPAAAAAHEPMLRVRQPLDGRLKARGFVRSRSSGTPHAGVVVLLRCRYRSQMRDRVDGETPVDDPGMILAELETDRVGYFSFDLSRIALEAADRLWVSLLHDEQQQVAILDRRAKVDLTPHLRDAVPPLFSFAVDGRWPSARNDRLVSIQEPDDLDWEISPASFVTTYRPGGCDDGDDCGCEPYAHSTFPVSEYFFHEITRLSSEQGRMDRRKGSSSQDVALYTGLLREYRQQWIPLGHALGDVVYSLTLAPCESVNFAVIDWVRNDKAQRLDGVEYGESLAHSLTHDRAIDEIVSATLEEQQSGWSIAGGYGQSARGNAGVGGTVPIPVEGVPIPVDVSLAGGVAEMLGIGGGYASSSGRRALTGDSVQNIADTVVQKSNLVRRLRSTAIVQSSQEEHSSLATRTVTNHNHCHALSVEYYEVVRHLKVVTEYVGTRAVIFVPFTLRTFDETTLKQFGYVFRATLLDRALQPCLATVLAHCGAAAATPTNGGSTPAASTTAAKTKVTVSFEKVHIVDDEDTFGSGELFFQGDVNGDATGSSGQLDLNSGDEHNFVGGAWQKTVELGPNDKLTVRFSGYDEDVTVHETLGEVTDTYSGPGFGAGRHTTTSSNGDFRLTYRIDTAPADDPAPDPAPAPAPTPAPADEAAAPDYECCVETLLEHLNANRVYYNKALWVHQDPDERALELLQIDVGGQPLLTQVENRPLAVMGNYVGFPVLDASGVEDQMPPPAVRRVAIPSRGLFAETMLSNCNACEKRDVTRFWDWQESPCPDHAPAIEGVQPGPQGQPHDVQPGTLPNPVIQIANTPAVPDPTGLGAAFALLGRGDVFRNMSMQSEVASLVSGLASGSMTLAQAQQKAASMQKTVAANGGLGGSGATMAPAQRYDNLKVAQEVAKQAKDLGWDDKTLSDVTRQIVGGGSGNGVASSGPEVVPAVWNKDDVDAVQRYAPSWEDLLRFTVPTAVRTALDARGMHVQTFWDAIGDLNLDLYPVRVTTLPTVGGKVLTAEELLDHIRLNLDDFVDTSKSSFYPYTPGVDDATWASTSPVGAVMGIKIFPDNAAVVGSLVESERWRFSTIWTPNTGGHPVSGNREFGFKLDDDGSAVFYTRGADRSTGAAETLGDFLTWSGADALWLSFQKKIVHHVTANGGAAIPLDRFSRRFKWTVVRILLGLPEPV